MLPAPPVPRLDVAAALDAFVTWSVRRTAPRDLSLSATATLATLAAQGPLRVSDLAAREGLAQPSMTALVTRLERDGLARRRPDPADRRVVDVVVTDAGRTALADRRRHRAEGLAALLEDLDDADRAVVEAAAPVLARLAGRTAQPVTPAEDRS